MAPMQKLDGGAPTGSSQVLLNKVKKKYILVVKWLHFRCLLSKELQAVSCNKVIIWPIMQIAPSLQGEWDRRATVV